MTPQTPSNWKQTKVVDWAAIRGKKMPLPGEVSQATSSYMEKSAEVIVVQL
ncbi:hypothetical protein [Maribacter sp. Hel_I_7]|uniref:hypothetical protein n=1 Tax=Maribacter sp. Hel_I_7 TaxID=1249997 RepID=UPI0012DCF72B|nr:hypothetical protein [Maribacter sp. Hel_I_7]